MIVFMDMNDIKLNLLYNDKELCVGHNDACGYRYDWSITSKVYEGTQLFLFVFGHEVNL
jgi:hypothetical protein